MPVSPAPFACAPPGRVPPVFALLLLFLAGAGCTDASSGEEGGSASSGGADASEVPAARAALEGCFQKQAGHFVRFFRGPGGRWWQTFGREVGPRRREWQDPPLRMHLASDSLLRERGRKAAGWHRLESGGAPDTSAAAEEEMMAAGLDVDRSDADATSGDAFYYEIFRLESPVDGQQYAYREAPGFYAGKTPIDLAPINQKECPEAALAVEAP